jgi:hypothetical protein
MSLNQPVDTTRHKPQLYKKSTSQQLCRTGGLGVFWLKPMHFVLSFILADNPGSDAVYFNSSTMKMEAVGFYETLITT